MSVTGRASARTRIAIEPARLPGQGVVGLEDEVEELGIREIAADATQRHAGRQRGRGAAGQEGDGDAVAGIDVLLDDRTREGGVGALDQVQDRGHQNARKRRPCRTSSAIRSRVIGMTSWRSAFQSVSDGIESASTWKGMPSALRFARNLAISSPSTSSSVSASSRCTAGPVSTKVTSFSPATTPSPIRMASLARCERRGSTEIRTTTGADSGADPAPLDTPAPPDTSVERDEAVGAVDQVGEHDQAAVREAVRVAQRDPALLAAVRAHEQPGAALGQGADPRVVERAHALVDEVDVYVGAPVQRRLREPDGGLEVGVLEPRRQEHAEFLLREIHRASSVAS